MKSILWCVLGGMIGWFAVGAAFDDFNGKTVKATTPTGQVLNVTMRVQYEERTASDGKGKAHFITVPSPDGKKKVTLEVADKYFETSVGIYKVRKNYSFEDAELPAKKPLHNGGRSILPTCDKDD